MNKTTLLYEDALHKCIMFSFDEEVDEEKYLSVNQFLVIHNGKGILIDPGSDNIFDELYDNVLEYIEAENIEYIFFSHQDPDVVGSILHWSIACNHAKILISEIWVRFISHYGFMDYANVMAIKDAGSTISLSGASLKLIPAHFLHSAGNFSLYDTTAKVLFSGDIGAAIVEMDEDYKVVEDFQRHQRYLELFHSRFMCSHSVVQMWVKLVSTYEVNTIAPQHGAIFTNKNVTHFLEWFNTLECATDNIEVLYGE